MRYPNRRSRARAIAIAAPADRTNRIQPIYAIALGILTSLAVYAAAVLLG